MLNPGPNSQWISELQKNKIQTLGINFMVNRQIRKMPYLISQCMAHGQGYSNEI